MADTPDFKFLFFGVLGGVVILLAQFLIPFTPVSFGVFELDTDDGNVGTRLQVGDFRFHHYMGGVALIGIAGLLYWRTKLPRNLLLFIMGVGLLLILDQVPNIIAQIMGDPEAWGATAQLSIVGRVL